ncbi:MAG: hypothetical protein ABIR47_05130 [Candidatus Kapaibacterium sp.]
MTVPVAYYGHGPAGGQGTTALIIMPQFGVGHNVAQQTVPAGAPDT